MEFIRKNQAIIAIVLFIATLIGWIVDSQVKKRVMQATIENHTEQIKELIQSDKNQIGLNSSFITYMKLN